MRKDKEVKSKDKNKFDKGQVFVKIMAGLLTIMMLMSVAGSLIFYLI